MNKAVKWMVGVVAALLVLVLAAGLLAGNYFCTLALAREADRSAVFGAEHNAIEGEEEEDAQWEALQAWFDGTGYKDIYMESFDELRLHAYVVENETPSHRWAILAHGYSGEARQMVSSGRWFYEQGYNLLMPDARGCGESESDYIGMGWHDRLDYVGWIESIVQRDPACEIVLYGVSMGGATVMMVSGEALPENVKVIVEDCGYTSAWDEFAYQMNAIFGLPAFPLMHFASLMARVRAGFWLGEASAVDQVAKSVTPTLFIHGSADTFVPYEMLDVVYEAASCEKQKYVVEGAGHGAAASVAGEEYWRTVREFIEKHSVEQSNA